MDWTDEQSLNFIEMYRSRPILWDNFNKEYKNRNRRHDLLNEIADSFAIEKNEVERKLKNLQSHFARERKKELDSRKTGSGADAPYVSRWFAYQALLFLADRNKPRKTVDNVEDSRTQSGTEKDGNGAPSENEEKEVEGLQNSLADEEDFLAISTPKKQSRNKIFKSPKNQSAMNSKRANFSSIKGVPIIDEAVNLMRSIQSKRADTTKDEYSLYGEQVAIKLRRLTSPKARFTVQNKINKALYEADIGMYDDNVHIRQQTPTTTRLIYCSPASSFNQKTLFNPMTFQSQTGIPTHAKFEVKSPSPMHQESMSPEIISSDNILDNIIEESYDEIEDFDPTTYQ